jgi:glycosylphosphatidylinositol transamidase (GPIT) subunit GPI8
MDLGGGEGARSKLPFYSSAIICLLLLISTWSGCIEARTADTAEWLAVSNHTNNWAVLVDTSRYWCGERSLSVWHHA